MGCLFYDCVYLNFVLVRPPDIVVDGLRFYCDSSSSAIYFYQLPSELAERSSTKTSHMLGTECDLKIEI